MAWNILELQRNTMEGIKDKDRCEGRRNNNSQFTGWDRFWSEVIFIGDAKVVVVKNQGERGWRNGTRRRWKDSSARRHHRREILEKKKSWERFVSGLVLEVTQERWDKEHDYKWFNNLSQVAFQISFLIAEEGAGTKRRCRRSDGDWKRQQSRL